MTTKLVPRDLIYDAAKIVWRFMAGKAVSESEANGLMNRLCAILVEAQPSPAVQDAPPPRERKDEAARLRDALQVIEMETRDSGQWGLVDVNDFVCRELAHNDFYAPHRRASGSRCTAARAAISDARWRVNSVVACGNTIARTEKSCE